MKRILFLLLLPVLCFASPDTTKNIVPRNDVQGGLGTAAKRWATAEIRAMHGIADTATFATYAKWTDSTYYASRYDVLNELKAYQSGFSDSSNKSHLADTAKAVRHDLVLDSSKYAGTRYKVYRALITQIGTGTPTVNVLENTLGVTPTFEYVSVGVYNVKVTGSLFALAKTFYQITQTFGQSTDDHFQIGWIDENTIRIITIGASIPDAVSDYGDERLYYTPILILVYP